ncbi:MAG: sigma-54-dependent Fis family transcriptional regulator [Candidatus Cloacimonadota bacterium]|nr:MAG: sigma-54-dependent Fis family transcriptional regulator [Candidatus Cloacimonadota bacterium]
MIKKPSILIVDNEKIVIKTLSFWLKMEGYRTETATLAEEAFEKCKKRKFNIAIVNLKLPKKDGIWLLQKFNEKKLEIPVIMITNHPSIETAVLSIKKGAYDYLPKPLNFEELGLIINKIIERQTLIAENILLREQLKEKYSFKNIIGKSLKMKRIFELIENVADTDSTVLIHGESGTGKEVIARAIHQRGSRREEPFITVNCAAIPDNLLESELFGHEKGAFTGAVSSKKGRFEMANGGTLFLDEIAEMNLNTQVDLLRVLQEREFRRVGGSKLITVDVRVIASSNKKIEKEVERGNFREDLYYRLNVIPLVLPPLRERKGDIPLLIQYFLDKYKKKKKREIRGVSKEGINLLINYNWPGNVRELENTIERIIVLGSGDFMTPKDLPGRIREFAKAKTKICYPINKPLEDIEKEYIKNVLSDTNWNITRAAKVLKINRMTLYNKIKKYNLKRKP